MDWTILSRERPSRARLLALTLSFLCTIAAVRVSGNAAAGGPAAAYNVRPVPPDAFVA